MTLLQCGNKKQVLIRISTRIIANIRLKHHHDGMEVTFSRTQEKRIIAQDINGFSN